MDFDAFTLLFRDDCLGLGIQKPGLKRQILKADPLRDALVFNVRDILI